jgi:hypothetical protein
VQSIEFVTFSMSYCYYLTGTTVGERARNRDRILQIRDLHSSCKDSLSSLLDSEDDEGFDEEDALGK